MIAPYGSGCSSIVMYPYLEKSSNRPRAVFGMFDISSRPFVPQNMLTLAVPMSKFVRMMDNMEESFLILPTWAKVQKRTQRNDMAVLMNLPKVDVYKSRKMSDFISARFFRFS